MAWRKDPSLNQMVTGRVEYNYSDADTQSLWIGNQTAPSLGTFTYSIFRPRNSSTVSVGSSLTGGENKPFFTVPASQRYRVRIVGGNYTTRHDASANIENYLGVDLYIGNALKTFNYTAQLLIDPTEYYLAPFLIPDGIDYWIGAGDKIYADTFPTGWDVVGGLAVGQAASYFHFEFSFQLIGYTDQ